MRWHFAKTRPRVPAVSAIDLKLMLTIAVCLSVCALSDLSSNAYGFQDFSVLPSWQQQYRNASFSNTVGQTEPQPQAIAAEPVLTEPQPRLFDYSEPQSEQRLQPEQQPQSLADQYLQEGGAEPLLGTSAAFGNSQPSWFGYSSPVRVSVHGGENYAEPTAFVSLDLLKPLQNYRFSDGSEQIQYFDGRIGVNFDGGALGNIGFGRKHYSARRNAIWEYGVWYDIDGTNDRIFNQVTGGVQLQGRLFSLRGHYYFPFGDTTSVDRYGDLTGNTSYQGNTLALERFRYEEQAYQGYEADVGLRLKAPLPTELRAGYYRFQADNAPEVSGVSAVLAVEVAPSLILAVNGTFDDDTDEQNVMFTATYDFYGHRTNEGDSIRRRMSEPVRRNRHIVSRIAAVNDPVAALNADGTTINIIHVSSAGNSTGAFESPYANLSQAVADANLTSNSIILAHADSVFDGQTIALPEDTRFLDETQSHSITTSQLGDLTLPRATTGTSAAIIRNSPAATPAITLANNSEVNGLRVEAAGGIGIFGDGLTVGTILRNASVDGAATGVRLQNTAGTTEISGLTVSNTTQDGIHLQNNTGALNLTSTTVNSAGRHGVWAEANAANITFDSLTVNTAGTNGLFVTDAVAGSTLALNTATTISNTGSHGLSLQTNRGTTVFSSNGTLAISDTTGDGIFMSANDDTTDAIFNGATTIARTTGNGLFVANTETTSNPFQADVEFLGGLTIGTTGQSGIAATNNGSNIGITTLAITDWQQSAIAINNGVGEFHVTNPLTLNNANASAASTILIQNVDSADITFGDVTITDTARTVLGAPTINLVENDTSVNQIGFGTLNVTSVNGTALLATQSGTNSMKLDISGGNLSSVGAAALSLTGSDTEITLQSVSAQNATIGILLDDIGDTAFHDYFRINGDGSTAGSGGTITNVQRGIVANSSDDVSLNYIDIDSSVSGVELTAVGQDQSQDPAVNGLRLTDAGGSANWIGIRNTWGSGAHSSGAAIFQNNSITGSGSGQVGLLVENVQSNPSISVNINANTMNLTGATSDGISLSSTGLLAGGSLGQINLSGTLNNLINVTQNEFITATATGGAINGTTVVNGVAVP